MADVAKESSEALDEDDEGAGSGRRIPDLDQGVGAGLSQGNKVILADHEVDLDKDVDMSGNEEDMFSRDEESDEEMALMEMELLKDWLTSTNKGKLF